MKEIKERPWEEIEAELMARMGWDKVLNLTMQDLRDFVSFESANLNDILGSRRPGYHASKVVLRSNGATRILKDKTSALKRRTSEDTAN